MERTLARLSRCRGVLIRWEKKPANYLGLLKLACALLRFRPYHWLASTGGTLHDCRWEQSHTVNGASPSWG